MEGGSNPEACGSPGSSGDADGSSPSQGTATEGKLDFELMWACFQLPRNRTLDARNQKLFHTLKMEDMHVVTFYYGEVGLLASQNDALIVASTNVSFVFM